MKLEIIETSRGKRFLWQHTDFGSTVHELTSNLIWVPSLNHRETIIICSSDGIEMSKGVLKGDRFEGLNPAIFPEDYPSCLRADWCEVGWTIEFTPRPYAGEALDPFFVRNFGTALFGLESFDNPELYYKEESK